MNKQIICAIHQPNFFPWLGYFDKIKCADIFIFMDNVAYPKCGKGTWINRVKISIQGNAVWASCPIKRTHGTQLIKDVVIDDTQPWRKKLLKTLEMNYKKSPNYGEAMAVLEPIVLYETDNLADFNINAIKQICKILKIESKFIRQSELNAEGSATQLLINLTKEVGATAYLCGGGAEGYQQDEMFQEQNIELIYQNYTPQPYCENFIPGLSVIDYLMHSPDAL